MRRQWSTWMVPGDDMLYVSDDNGTFTTHQQMHFDFDGAPLAHHQAIPIDAVPVDADRRVESWKVSLNNRQWELPQAPPHSRWHIHQYILTIPDWEQHLLRHLQLNVSQLALVQALTTSSVLLASDGSQQEHRASFGWILSDHHGNRLATCKGPAYGAKPVSYRAEGYGILSALRFFYHLAQRWNTTPKFTLLCDNITMVRRSNDNPNLSNPKPNSTLDSDWDLLVHIWDTKAALNITDCVEWVKSHQDDGKPYDELPLKAQLNVDADALADSYILEYPDLDYHTVIPLPLARAQLQIALWHSHPQPQKRIETRQN